MGAAGGPAGAVIGATVGGSAGAAAGGVIGEQRSPGGASMHMDIADIQDGSASQATHQRFGAN